MSIVTANWVGENTSTVGIGAIILGGAIQGFARFNVMGDGDVYYVIQDGLAKETGLGTLVGNTLTRTTINATIDINGVYSSTPSPMSLSGNAQVFGIINAEFMATLYNNMQDVFDSAAAAVQSAQEAVAAASTATSASAAASNSALAAQGSESNAASSASSASTSSNNAHNSEVAAKTSETNAKASETSTAGVASAALASQNAAKASQDAAKISETNSANSATAANGSKTAAANSATAASTSATNAAGSATAAATSEQNALQSKNSASGSATAASTSATNASNSASAAATSATNAKNSADDAAATAAGLGSLAGFAGVLSGNATTGFTFTAAFNPNSSTVSGNMTVGGIFTANGNAVLKAISGTGLNLGGGGIVAGGITSSNGVSVNNAARGNFAIIKDTGTGGGNTNKLALVRHNSTQFVEHDILNDGSNVNARMVVTNNSIFKTFRFSDNGNGICDGQWAGGSDERHKTNITIVPNALEAVLSWRGCTYDKKEGDPEVGLIAQDVEPWCPIAIISYGDRIFGDGTVIKNFKNLNTSGVSAAYHTEAIKALHNIIQGLMQRIDALENK